MERMDNHVRASPLVTSKRITIYYDGTCKLCSSIINDIKKSPQHKNIDHIDAAKGVLPQGVTIKAAMRDVHVMDGEGKLHVGVDGVLKVIEQYPELRFFAKFGRLPGVYFLARGLYRFIEKSRYQVWGRKK
jgi:predicted DCC family thiol-disulfide oxidoreductase YuxK